MTRTEEFKAKFHALLQEYDVEMSVVEETKGYHTQVVGVNFWSYTKYGTNGEVVAEGVDYTTGTWEDGK
jgi:gamma-glutamyl:cysteine ligase YbdK (ATP-grasp superfamily)